MKPLPMTIGNTGRTRNLLYVAGFLLILSFGHVSKLAFGVGAGLYILGALWSYKYRQFSITLPVILFVTNLVFYVTRELVPLVDVSFALYWLILLDIVILVTLNAQIARL